MKKIVGIVVFTILLGFVGGKWYLSNKSSIPQIDIVELEKDKDIENAKSDLTKDTKQIHYSVDDVIEGFINLSINNYDSIFEEEHFSFLKKIHDKYDVNVSAYVFFENEEYNLTDITDKYALEFQENSNWLKFGFHSLNSKTNYSDADATEAKKDYEKVVRELIRITGGVSTIDRTVRLHNYSASEEALKGFQDAKLGIEKLLSPEDKRLAYNLELNETSYLYQYDYFTVNDLEYIKTDVRLENLDNAEDFYNSFIHQNELNEILVIFTHESYLTDREVQNKSYQLLELFEGYTNSGF